jgi:hypothetical protein
MTSDKENELFFNRKALTQMLNQDGQLERVLLLSAKHFDTRQRLLKLAEEASECTAAIIRFLGHPGDDVNIEERMRSMVEEIVDVQIVITDVLVNHIMDRASGTLDCAIIEKIAKFQAALDKLERASSGEN